MELAGCVDRHIAPGAAFLRGLLVALPWTGLVGAVSLWATEAVLGAGALYAAFLATALLGWGPSICWAVCGCWLWPWEEDKWGKS